MDYFFRKDAAGKFVEPNWATDAELWRVALTYAKATSKAPFFTSDTYALPGGVTLDLAGRVQPQGYQQYLDALAGAALVTVMSIEL